MKINITIIVLFWVKFADESIFEGSKKNFKNNNLLNI